MNVIFYWGIGLGIAGGIVAFSWEYVDQAIRRWFGR